MRIVYVGQPATKKFSGPSVHIREVIDGLVARGHQVEYRPSCEVSGGMFRQICQRIQFARELSAWLKPSRPDWVYQREQLFDPFVAEACYRLKIPYAVEINGLVLKELQRDRARPWTLLIARLLQKWALQRATAIIVPAANWSKLLQQEHGTRLTKFHFVQNGVNLEQFATRSTFEERERWKLPQEAVIIGFLGSIYRNYDFAPILKAVRHVYEVHPELRLVIAGPGPRRAEVTELISGLGLESVVQLHDPVSHADAPSLIGCFDVCLMPYCKDVLIENNGQFSMKLQEYTAAGKPLLSHDLPSSDTYTEANQFGWTFEPDSASGAIKALEAALASEADRKQKGAAARHYASTRSWAGVAEKVELALLKSFNQSVSEEVLK